MSDSLQLELEAGVAYVQLLRDAQACKALYARAGSELPPPLKRLLGEAAPVVAEVKAPVVTPAMLEKPKTDYTSSSSFRKQRAKSLPGKPDRQVTPTFADVNSWVSIPVAEASPDILTYSVLREVHEPLSQARISSIVAKLRGMEGSGAAYNVIRRAVEAGDVVEMDGGYVLANRERGGEIVGNWLFAPISQMTDADLANHRREGILLILRTNPGLVTAAIARGLQGTGWIQAPVNGHHVKADLAALVKKGLVKRAANKTWWLKDQEPPAKETP